MPDSMGVIDHGSYYAARTMANTGDRRILWGWITEGRTRRRAEAPPAGAAPCPCLAN
jgi:beta-fructofuranosidase